MRAMVLRAAGRPMEVEDLHMADPGAHEVRVRVVAAGVCRTDLDAASGRSPVETPVVLGHESAGVVTDVGSDVTEVNIGELVVGTPAPGCGRCEACRTGRPFLCSARSTRRSGGDEPRLTLADGTPVGQFSGLGGFAEGMLVHESAVVPIDPAVPWAAAALLGCGALTGIGAVLRTARVRAGDRTVVLGLGGVGLAALQACRLVGALRIVAVDVDPMKLEAGLRFGATDAVQAGSDIEAVRRSVRAATGGGADAAFDCVGTPETLESAYEMTRTGGTTVLVGGFAPGQRLSLPGLDFVVRGKALLGSSLGSSVPKVDIPVYAQMVLQGRLPLDQLVTDTFALSELNVAFDALRSARVGRALIEFDR